MSFIGTLDQFDLSIILQKIEEYRKTGLLVVKQGETAVELFVRQGQLICIGPVKPHVSLGERLVQVRAISQEACQSVESSLGELRYSENDAAHAFINAGCFNQDSLKHWSLTEASQVLHAILAWEDGELYFQEDQAPPIHRLSVPLSMLSLLPTASPAPDTYSHASSSISADALITRTGFPADGERHTDALSRDTVSALQPPQRVTDPIPPVRVDISYLQPNTVLVPADLSAYRDRNPQLVLMPEQWRLFTCANGETTLFMAAQELSMSAEQVCRIAGELLALGLVTILSQGAPLASAVPDPVTGMGDNAGIAGYYGLKPDEVLASYPRNSVAIAPAPAIAFHSLGQPIETQSQWGNGGNGATFQLGSGWVVSPSSPQFNQHTQQDDPALEHSTVFARAS